ncbi:coiled-coil domain-containing protein [Actinorugispora endophytica]|uniref:ARB-07466-like C-terminal domain-containing protein n=1 Tax=Actinorugispora endophytica TaxID=1605990 RepID=A0A4R6UM52_9ACTN|nr:hypothetical protein [Actinorugispora endophytica]TDQ47991.1 hypothetical protein EV190_12050 [Actinorugispora endophytica]
MIRSRKPPFSRAHRRGTVVAAALVAAVLALQSPGYADPDEEEVTLEELNEQADALEEEYDGELVQYTSAKDAAEKAEKDLEDVQERLENARGDVAQLAAGQYKSTGLDPTVEIVLSSSPEQMLDDASLLSQLSHNSGARVSNLEALEVEAEAAQEEADSKLDEAQELVDDLEEQRDEILAKIEKYEAEQVPETPGNGTVPADAQGPGFDGVTPRMAAIRDDLIGQFGAPYPVGCLRPGDSGEHGSGRACDFMMSAGGGMPSAENQQLGTQMAEYARNNADRLGIMYVIWEQKIWDSRNPGAGWKPMSDRGSITQNHYDHVHVSSY